MKPLLLVILLFTALARGDETNEVPMRLRALEEGISQLDAKLSRQMNELLWLEQLRDLAVIDKVRFTGPPPHTTNDPAPPAGSNEVIVSALTFMPRHHSHWRKVPLIVIGGRDFGSGSSRDWAAKGPALLGVRAVIARSFERIHRSNLIGVGIVPLLFAGEDSVDTLGLDGSEELAFEGVAAGIAERSPIVVSALRRNGDLLRFDAHADVRSDAEADLLQRGGMFQAALERMAQPPAPGALVGSTF